MHRRTTPKTNKFRYRVFYLLKNLDHLETLPQKKWLKINQFGLMSFYPKDHGAKDGTSLKKWAERIGEEHGVEKNTCDVFLLSFPRVLGYVFNPVTFWFYIDKKTQKLRAVLSQVNNTFGETHNYFCETQGFINQDDWMEGKKVFHVSPFLEREGTYRFRFSWQEKKLGIWIDHCDEKGNKILLTSLVGFYENLNEKGLKKCFFQYPLVTFKTIFLIHYQALKLFKNGIRYIRKPLQKKSKTTKVIKMKKN